MVPPFRQRRHLPWLLGMAQRHLLRLGLSVRPQHLYQLHLPHGNRAYRPFQTVSLQLHQHLFLHRQCLPRVAQRLLARWGSQYTRTDQGTEKARAKGQAKARGKSKGRARIWEERAKERNRAKEWVRSQARVEREERVGKGIPLVVSTVANKGLLMG